ncbi:MAG TPA: nuclease-related domain-containing protein [Streptosporangiaceae bacterium]|nr:nuclease-related domain-containing protein [Streptosporangiaceae bacterium]
MRVVQLSDHPSDLLKRSRQRVSKEQQRELQRYDNALARHQAELKRLVSARDTARTSRHWLAWIRGMFAVRRARRMAPVQPRFANAASEEEAILMAGIKGEQSVADALGRSLNDDWVLFRGYHNPRGEIDHVLLGPRGLVAIEVKNISGVVSCDGDRWWVDKYDRFGNRKEREDLLDRGRRPRSPSMQLNEPADLLEDFLRSRREDVDLLRVVFLAHERSEIGTCRGARVHIFTEANDIGTLMRKVPQPFNQHQRKHLEELIIADHRHHAARRPR